MAISLALPWMEWNGFYSFTATAIPVSIVSTVNIPLNLYADVLPAQTNDTIFVVVKYLFIIYLLFAAMIGGRLLLSYLNILSTVRSKRNNATDCSYTPLLNQCKKAVGLKKEIHLILHDKKISPFSWMNHVVISRADIDEDGKEILIHELSHVKYRHSWDILLVDLLIIFQWFNPIVWLYKQSLLETHEYMADKAVLDTGVNSKLYQLLLIKKTTDTRCCYSMTNSLNQSKLKNRIIMMLKEKSSKWAMAKCLYLLPLVSISATLFAMPKVSDHLAEISSIELLGDSATVDVTYKVIGYENENNRSDTSKVIVVSSGKMNEADGVIRSHVGDVKKKPLVIVDGKETMQDISSLDPNTIETMSVLKDKPAREIYGEKAKDGVIVITTRKSNNVNNVIIEANASSDMEDISLLKEDARKQKHYSVSYKTNNKTASFAVHSKNGVLSSLTVVEMNDDRTKKSTVNVLDKDSKYLIVINDKVSTASELSKLPTDGYYISILKGEDAIKKYGDKAKEGVVVVKTVEKKV
jgi:beta-lactamase regulating signal transducer with metallopeptidase domain